MNVYVCGLCGYRRDPEKRCLDFGVRPGMAARRPQVLLRLRRRVPPVLRPTRDG